MALKRNIFLGIALIIAAGLLWGGMGTAVQYLFSSNESFTPLQLVTVRQLSAGALFIGAASLFMPGRMWGIWKNPRLLADIVVSGALIFGAHYSFFESIYYSNAGTGAILLTTVPLFCGVWYAVTQRRMVSPAEIVCFFLAASGVMLIVTNGNLSELMFSPLALSWGMLSAVIAAAYSIQPLKAIAKVGVIPVVAWGLLFGGCFASFMCPPWTISLVWTPSSFAAFGFIVVFGTILAFWSYMAGLKYVSPVMAGLLNCTEPLSAFLFSILLLGDTLGLAQFIGILLVMANVCLLALAKGRR